MYFEMLQQATLLSLLEPKSVAKPLLIQLINTKDNFFILRASAANWCHHHLQ
jgi:hypothetical protein